MFNFSPSLFLTSLSFKLTCRIWLPGTQFLSVMVFLIQNDRIMSNSKESEPASLFPCCIIPKELLKRHDSLKVCFVSPEYPSKNQCYWLECAEGGKKRYGEQEWKQKESMETYKGGSSSRTLDGLRGQGTLGRCHSKRKQTNKKQLVNTPIEKGFISYQAQLSSMQRKSRPQTQPFKLFGA